MSKNKNIKVQFLGGAKGARKYVVDRVTDSLEFNPGQILTERQVEELCGKDRWKVTIVAQKDDDGDEPVKGDE